jgi:TonB family protein
MRTLSLSLALFALACSSNPAPPPNTSGAAGGSGETPASAGGSETSGGGEEGASEGGGEEGGEEAGPAEGEGGGEDSRTTQSIQKVILDNRKPIRACYDQHKKDLPTLKGTMTIHFVLDPEGNVKKAELNLERSDIKAPGLVDCALAHLKKLKFPPSSKGMDTTVNYPFDFKPDGGG